MAKRKAASVEEVPSAVLPVLHSPERELEGLTQREAVAQSPEAETQPGSPPGGMSPWDFGSPSDKSRPAAAAAVRPSSVEEQAASAESQVETSQDSVFDWAQGLPNDLPEERANLEAMGLAYNSPIPRLVHTLEENRRLLHYQLYCNLDSVTSQDSFHSWTVRVRQWCRVHLGDGDCQAFSTKKGKVSELFLGWCAAYYQSTTRGQWVTWSLEARENAIAEMRHYVRLHGHGRAVPLVFPAQSSPPRSPSPRSPVDLDPAGSPGTSPG
jgi:hypothetical protein